MDASAARKIRTKFPDHVPVICNAAPGSSDIFLQKKILIQAVMQSDVLRGEICKHLKRKMPDICSEQVVCFLAGGKVLELDLRMRDVYDQHKDEDEFLYVTFEIRNTPVLEEAPPPLAEVPSEAPALAEATALAEAPGAPAFAEASALAEAPPEALTPTQSEPVRLDSASQGSSKLPASREESSSVRGSAKVEELSSPEPPNVEETQLTEVQPSQKSQFSSKSSGPELVSSIPFSALTPELEPPKSKGLAKCEVSDPEAKQMLMKHPDRIPVLCERAPRSELPDMESIKLLVPGNMPCGELKYIIHKRVLSATNIASNQTIYLFVNATTPKTGTLLSDLYEQYRSPDGFLRVVFSVENTLGETR